MRFAFDLAAIPGRIKETLSFSEFPCVAVNSICMLFHSSIADKEVAEVLHLDENNKIWKVEAHYQI